MTITVYSKPACPQCTATKKHLEKRGLEYSEGDMNQIHMSARARGITAAPVVVVDGDEMWGGYRPDRIDALVA
jgi:glutaredoxin-like protein NrdH